jgi:hypothetical protein
MGWYEIAALIVTLLRTAIAIFVLFGASLAHAQVTLTQGTNFSVDVASDGRLAMDLLGDIWTLQATGGEAIAVPTSGSPARRPRWAPDGNSIVYQSRTESQDQLWLHSLDDGSSLNVSDGRFFDQHPDWHPDGERIVYSSARRDTGFDLWELDLATRLTWRISHLPGDETEPAWSEDGHDLVYVHFKDGQWSLMLRRRGQPDRVLETSNTRLSSPSWRPDGSLVTFLRHADDGYSMDMVILANPLLVRPMITGEDFFVAPVTWIDRQNLIYTAGGSIRTRQFNSWTPRTLPFRALVRRDKPAERAAIEQRRLPDIEEPTGRLVLRTARLFDGIGGGYREGLDIVIDGGKIAALEERRDRPESIIVDMSDLTALPGYIDSHAALPTVVDDALGPVLLSYGVTTVVADHSDAERLDILWSGKEMPGPRVLSGDWQVNLDWLTSMVLGTDTLPLSPAGIRYENGKLSDSEEPAMILSGLADARTRGLRALLHSRQADLVDHYPTAVRRFAEKPQLDVQSPAIVLGTTPNGLPPGIALHAEFRALAEAGLQSERILRAAGIYAASALGLGLRIGRIAPGASADLVIVDGDPLASIDNALKIVGVVRNGRFYSAIGLIERAEQAKSVD